MSALIEPAAKHWRYVAPLLAEPRNEADYDALVESLDELVTLIGDDETHPLASLASHVGDLLLAWDEAHRPLPSVAGADALRYLMQEHGLSQADLPEIGAQSVVSEILAGKRQLNVRHIRALTARFGLPADVFL